ncbi:hypothetical protein SAMN05428975_5456 [Mucilaginibacter sp. OK268]|uniref:hypothetical protein n=1 Tax=Mucilaginibacter sp. OK268 TaxID=1881048 RepID=UPI00088F3C8D|nr:hypothetical protein [Mucilaginibacter sp. OK268]SDQ00731.1 hypothetical protein SAMN05428975_5456 [Mucilaginibacter sp. OK268]
MNPAINTLTTVAFAIGSLSNPSTTSPYAVAFTPATTATLFEPAFIRRKESRIVMHVIEYAKPNHTDTESTISAVKGLHGIDSNYNDDTYMSNLSSLIDSFDHDLGKTQNSISVNYDQLYNGFYELAFKLADLNFKKSLVELLPDDAVKVSMKFNNEQLLLVTKSLKSVDDLKENEIVISLFKNKKRIVSDVFEVDSFVEGFQKFLAV